MVLSLVCALSACTDAPDDVVETSGPIADGFVIEPGSALVGAVFPEPYPYFGEGRQAVLRVDGDLARVFDGYVRQAEELGWSFDASFQDEAGQWCRDPEDWYPGDQYSDDPSSRQQRLGCSAYAPGPDGRELSLSGSADTADEAYIHLRTSRQSENPPPFTAVSEGSVAPVTDVEIAPLFAPVYDDPPTRLVEGSAALADPVVFGFPGAGYKALLRVDGDLAPVMRGYAEQFMRAGFTSPEGLIRIDDELILGTEIAGGGTLTAVAVPGDPSYVLIERIGD